MYLSYSCLILYWKLKQTLSKNFPKNEVMKMIMMIKFPLHKEDVSSSPKLDDNIESVHFYWMWVFFLVGFYLQRF